MKNESASLERSIRRSGLLAFFVVAVAIILSSIGEKGFYDEHFGPGPFGLPPHIVAMIIELILYIPFFWVFRQLMRLAYAARGTSIPPVVYMLAGAAFDPSLKRSQIIAYSGLGYFVVLLAGWITFTAIRGI